jgi:hypothetical protein
MSDLGRQIEGQKKIGISDPKQRGIRSTVTHGLQSMRPVDRIPFAPRSILISERPKHAPTRPQSVSGSP